jgi:rhodanese-related sulfurtransferase
MGLLDLLFGGNKKAAYLKELHNNGAIIVDVRTAEEFRTGHIKNSINIPLQQLSQKIASLKQKNKPVITVCLSGGRSSMAVSVLKKAGIEAYNGGGWSSLENKL